MSIKGSWHRKHDRKRWEKGWEMAFSNFDELVQKETEAWDKWQAAERKAARAMKKARAADRASEDAFEIWKTIRAKLPYDKLECL